MYLQLLLASCFVAYNHGEYTCGYTYFTSDEENHVGPVDLGSWETSTTKSCEYKIVPSQRHVYTILEWDDFTIDDNMPKCSLSSVTVFVG